MRQKNQVALWVGRFGQGYYNGFGGKVETGETVEEAAAREVGWF